MPEGHWAGAGLLIANPLAGARSAELIDAVAHHCGSRVTDLTVVRTEYRGHAEELAAKAFVEGTDVVIAMGGDGTTREVAGGLARAALDRPGSPRPALVNIPAGTGNSFYREVWSDRPWQEALDTALSGDRPHIRHVDMAYIHETDAYALLGAASGLVADALVVAAGLSEVQGRDRYQQAVAQVLADFTPYPGRISVDGKVVHDGPVVLANVGGGRYRAGRFKVLPHSVLDDGLLDICVITGGIDPRELPGLTRDGQHVGRPEVVYERGSRFVFERTDGNPLTFEYDGEAQTEPRQRYTVAATPGILPVLAPPERT
ncbi:diacylglycerol/lipid kinase family protein [Wenjunlia tyrosinilytica]|uniref:DAGKc domain-containing protein n=1 Tax=Wenjunlia tyrosinilytica TaxID=1544741 RepID=A0A917ZUD9_9ACTN|nr:diacylglycerol kinase family protein [Wenjunlia tyrosinilytica]GGO90648.1 hypothetical protein GCM10012280_36650 [Wenjunlia tyrosinilytica]